MESLGLIAVLVGIVTGAITILEKTWGLVPGRGVSRRRFRKLRGEWKANDHIVTPDAAEVRRFAGYMTRAKLTPEDSAFALQAALYAGDPCLHALIEKNDGNPIALKYLVPRLAGPGIRAGWRTEYALSRLSANATLEDVLADPHSSSALRAAARRVLEGSVVQYLRTLATGEDQKLRAYAVEVLQQLGESLAIGGGEEPQEKDQRNEASDGGIAG